MSAVPKSTKAAPPPTLATGVIPDDEEQARLAEWDARMGALGARVADDCFCECCGRRGALGRFCPTCERS